MGLFSKLFSKKEEKEKLPEQERFHFDSCTEQELLNSFALSWLGIFRNGEIQLSFDNSGIYASDITVRLKADGTKEIKYTDDNYEEHCDKL